jgi:hypothetical protein
MKLTTGALSAACLAVFSWFAASTPAQQATHDLRDQLHLTGQPANSLQKIAAQAAAQQKLKDDAVPSGATSDCAYTFTSGTGTAYLQFCVSVNGNITEFQSPEGVEQIRQGAIGEGYGICDESTYTPYSDYADYGATSNWNAPVLLAQTKTIVKIERTTSDNLFTLAQTISLVAGTPPYAKVEMQLKNNSATIKEAYLVRWADSDPDNANADGFSQNLDSTDESAFAWVSFDSFTGNDPYGLMLQADGVPTNAVNYARGGLAYSVASPPNPCDAGTGTGAPILDTDGSIAYVYYIGIPKEQTVNVTERYVRF